MQPHYLIEQSNRTRTHLPVWMTEQSAAAIAITATPRLSAQVLLALRTLVDSVLFARSLAHLMKEEAMTQPTVRQHELALAPAATSPLGYPKWRTRSSHCSHN